MVRLIRSKGVGVYFVTQNPIDIPDDVLGQLGNRVQHALRAFTPRDQKAVKAAAETFRSNPKLNVEKAITELEVGEALVSFLDEKGTPGMVERAYRVPAARPDRADHSRAAQAVDGAFRCRRRVRQCGRSRVGLRAAEGPGGRGTCTFQSAGAIAALVCEPAIAGFPRLGRRSQHWRPARGFFSNCNGEERGAHDWQFGGPRDCTWGTGVVVGRDQQPEKIVELSDQMVIEIGHVEAIFRYPVKSMAGEQLTAAELGWHGIEGDRRLALRRVNDHSGFPWLTATKLPELLLYAPQPGENASGELPTHVRTADGRVLPVFSPELAAEIGDRYGAAVEVMQLRHGVFDDASISVIASDTVNEISRMAGVTPDVRRFRPNVLVRLLRSAPFQEDDWLGGTLYFGEGDQAPAVAVTMRDIRCSMVNLDPDSAKASPEVLKAVVRANRNNAGIYGTVVRTGRVEVGQSIFLRAATTNQARLAASF